MPSQTDSAISSLALVVLALLDEAPMYPYRMQQLIRERGMDLVVNVRHRASLYQAIARLERVGLIAVHKTARAENRPERTVYELTDAGRASIHRRLRQMLAAPAPEFPSLPAALSFIYLLDPPSACEELERRAEALGEQSVQLSAQLVEHSGTVPRLFLLELEYLRTTTDAELAWVRALADDIRAGRLTWDRETIRAAHDQSEGDVDA